MPPSRISSPSSREQTLGGLAFQSQHKKRGQLKSVPSKESVSDALAIVRSRKFPGDSPKEGRGGLAKSSSSAGDLQQFDEEQLPNISHQPTVKALPIVLTTPSHLVSLESEKQTSASNGRTSPMRQASLPHYTTPTSASIASRYRSSGKEDTATQPQQQQLEAASASDYQAPLRRKTRHRSASPQSINQSDKLKKNTRSASSSRRQHRSTTQQRSNKPLPDSDTSSSLISNIIPGKEKDAPLLEGMSSPEVFLASGAVNTTVSVQQSKVVQLNAEASGRTNQTRDGNRSECSLSSYYSKSTLDFANRFGGINNSTDDAKKAQIVSSSRKYDMKDSTAFESEYSALGGPSTPVCVFDKKSRGNNVARGKQRRVSAGSDASSNMSQPSRQTVTKLLNLVRTRKAEKSDMEVSDPDKHISVSPSPIPTMASSSNNALLRSPLSHRQDYTDEDTAPRYEKVSLPGVFTPDLKMSSNYENEELIGTLNHQHPEEAINSPTIVGESLDQSKNDDGNIQSILDNYLRSPNQIRNLLVNHIRRLITKYDSNANSITWATHDTMLIGENQRTVDERTLWNIETLISRLVKSDKDLAKELAMSVKRAVSSLNSDTASLQGVAIADDSLRRHVYMLTSDTVAIMENFLDEEFNNYKGPVNYYPRIDVNVDIFSEECEMPSWEAAASDEEIVFGDVQTKALDTVSKNVDSMPLKAASDELRPLEGANIVNDYKNCLSPLEVVTSDLKQTDSDENFATEPPPTVLTAISRYIDFVVTGNGDAEKESNGQIIISSDYHLENRQDIVSDKTSLDPQILASIGTYIKDSTGTNKKLRDSLAINLDMGARALMNHDFHDSEDDPFMTDLKTSSTESIDFQRDEIHPKTLAAIGEYIDTLAVSKQNREDYDDIRPPRTHCYSESIRNRGSIQQSEKLQSQASGHGLHIPRKDNQSECYELVPFLDRFGQLKDTTSNEIVETEFVVETSNDEEDPLIERLRKMKEHKNEVSLNRNLPSGTLRTNPYIDTEESFVRDPLIERLRTASTDKASLIEKMRHLSSASSECEGCTDNGVAYQPRKQEESVPESERSASLKLLLDNRRLMISKEKLESETPGSDSSDSLSHYEKSDVNEETMEAVRDYIDIVHANKGSRNERNSIGFLSRRKVSTRRTAESSVKNINDIGTLIDNITFKVATQSGLESESVLSDLITEMTGTVGAIENPNNGQCEEHSDNDVGNQFSYITAQAERSKTTISPRTSTDKQLKDPPIVSESHSYESSVSSTTNDMHYNMVPSGDLYGGPSNIVYDVTDYCFDDADEYLPYPACYQGFKSLPDRNFDARYGGGFLINMPLSPIVDATDEDSATNHLSTIPDVTDEDDSTTIQSSIRETKSSEPPQDLAPEPNIVLNDVGRTDFGCCESPSRAPSFSALSDCGQQQKTELQPIHQRPMELVEQVELVELVEHDSASTAVVDVPRQVEDNPKLMDHFTILESNENRKPGYFVTHSERKELIEQKLTKEEQYSMEQSLDVSANQSKSQEDLRVKGIPFGPIISMDSSPIPDVEGVALGTDEKTPWGGDSRPGSDAGGDIGTRPRNRSAQVSSHAGSPEAENYLLSPSEIITELMANLLPRARDKSRGMASLIDTNTDLQHSYVANRSGEPPRPETIAISTFRGNSSLLNPLNSNRNVKAENKSGIDVVVLNQTDSVPAGSNAGAELDNAIQNPILQRGLQFPLKGTSLIVDDVFNDTSIVRSCSSNDADSEKTESVMGTRECIRRQTDHVEEKKNDDDLWRDHTVDSAVRHLFPLLAGSIHNSDTAIINFTRLVRYSFPFVNSNQPGAYVVSQLLGEAQKLRIPLDSVDRFLELSLLQVQDNEELKKVIESPLVDEEQKLVCFLSGLIAIAEEKFGGAESSYLFDKIPNGSLVSIRSSIEEAIEIDLHAGFVDKTYAPATADADGEEPWWEVAARLNSLSHEQQFTPTHVLNSADNGQLDTANAAGDDATLFWKDRSVAVTKVSRKHGKVKTGFRRLTTSTYNVEDSEKGYLEQKRPALTISKQSSWRTQASWMSAGGGTVQDSISAVQAASSLLEDGINIRKTASNVIFPQVWKQSYVERTQNHDGFLDIDVYSLYDSVPIGSRPHALDTKPWEHRVVKQRFLHEQSLSMSRNWFGSITFKDGNQKVKHRICKIQSMQMPMKADEWTKEWYQTKWAEPLPSNVSEKTNGTESLERHMSGLYASPSRSKNQNESVDESYWEAVPECGKLKAVLLKPGDRISRITPDWTSCLRRSRWRKKYLPRGISSSK